MLPACRPVVRAVSSSREGTTGVVEQRYWALKSHLRSFTVLWTHCCHQHKNQPQSLITTPLPLRSPQVQANQNRCGLEARLSFVHHCNCKQCVSAWSTYILQMNPTLLTVFSLHNDIWSVTFCEEGRARCQILMTPWLLLLQGLQVDKDSGLSWCIFIEHLHAPPEEEPLWLNWLNDPFSITVQALTEHCCRFTCQLELATLAFATQSFTNVFHTTNLFELVKKMLKDCTSG